MDINTFECIPKIDLPPRTRYLDLIWTYRRKRRPDRSLKKYKAGICVNGSRQIQGIDYTEILCTGGTMEHHMYGEHPRRHAQPQRQIN
jgi:hypothetical protein